MKSLVSWIRKYQQHGGMALVYLGAILLVIGFMAGWQSNMFLIGCILIMIAGIVVHVRTVKKQSKY